MRPAIAWFVAAVVCMFAACGWARGEATRELTVHLAQANNDSPYAFVRAKFEPGEVAEGVQVRLGNYLQQWPEGRSIVFRSDFRNQGRRRLIVYRTEAMGELELDGQWHRWNGDIEAKSSPFGPGDHYEDIQFNLRGSWVNKDTGQPLKFPALGKHTVRMAVVAKPVEQDPGQSVRAVSNPVEFEVIPEETTEFHKACDFLRSGAARDEAARRFAAIAERWPEPRLTEFDQYFPGLRRIVERAAELAGQLRAMAKEDETFKAPQLPLSKEQEIALLIYQLRDVAETAVWVPGRVNIFLSKKPDSPAVRLRDMHYRIVPEMIRLLDDRRPTRSVDDPMNGGHVLRYCDVALQIIGSIAGHPDYRADKLFDERTRRGTYLGNADEETRRQIIDRVKAWWAQQQVKAAPPWGEAVEGVQVRLRADKTQWKAGETPTFKADVRNQGTRDFSVAQAQQLCELEVDGQWCTWTGDISVKSSAFPPGREYKDIPICLDSHWQSKEKRKPVDLSVGRHTVRVAFIAEPAERGQGQPVRAVTNPVEIEILPAKVETRMFKIPSDHKAQEFASILREWLAKCSDYPLGSVEISVDQRENAISVTGPERFMETVAQLLRRPPKEPPTVVWVFTLASAKPTDVAEAVKKMFGDRGVTASVDDRRPEIVVAARQGDMEAIKKFVQSMDGAGTPSEKAEEPPWGEAVEGVRGRVLDHEGNPVRGATVLLATEEVTVFGGELDRPKVPRTVTDGEGRFVIAVPLPPAGRLIVTAPTIHAWLVPLAPPGQEILVRLPRPATLTVRYNVPGGPETATFSLHLHAWEMPEWKGWISTGQKFTVRNGGEVVLRDVTPGLYDLQRRKAAPVPLVISLDIPLDWKRELTLDPGESRTADFVRNGGQRLQGRVTGLAPMGLPGAWVTVLEAVGDRDMRKVTILAFDLVGVGPDGAFQTELLPPGKYTLVAESDIYRHDLKRGIPLCHFRGLAEVTIPREGREPIILAMNLAYFPTPPQPEPGWPSYKEVVQVQVLNLIDGLGTEDSKIQDVARKALVALGTPAVPALREAAKGDKPVAKRAREVLDQITAASGEKGVPRPNPTSTSPGGAGRRAAGGVVGSER